MEASDERIDMDRLKVRHQIGFYSDIVLFEDELHDSGCSVLNVKIVGWMPSVASKYLVINVSLRHCVSFCPCMHVSVCLSVCLSVIVS